MKIHLLSDLHNEFQPFSPPATDADVVVLAGDIHCKGRAVAWAQAHFDKPVVLVFGNHDYWGGSLGHTLHKAQEQAKGSNVHFLHNSSVVLGGVRFLGTTLWTDFDILGNAPLAMWDAQSRMNDYCKIRNATFGRLRPSDTLRQHMQAREFLMDALSQPFDGPTVVVTHHAPSELCIPQRYRDAGDNLMGCYASRMEHFLGDVPLWVHGHIHDSHDFMFGDTRVVCNPRGYEGVELNPDFNPHLILEI